MKKDNRITFRVSDGQMAVVDFLALNWGVTKTAVITNILNAYIYQNGYYNIMHEADHKNKED